MCGRIDQRRRASAALAAAIVRCDPEDAGIILAGALDVLSAGAPPTRFLDLAEEAQEWAAWAAPDELYHYGMAILAELGRTPVRRAWRRNLARLALAGLSVEECRQAFAARGCEAVRRE